MERVVRPALETVAAEFRQLGCDATLSTAPTADVGIDEHTLVVSMDEDRDFHYRVPPSRCQSRGSAAGPLQAPSSILAAEAQTCSAEWNPSLRSPQAKEQPWHRL